MYDMYSMHGICVRLRAYHASNDASGVFEGVFRVIFLDVSLMADPTRSRFNGSVCSAS
jgi:hypothetical protein